MVVVLTKFSNIEHALYRRIINLGYITELDHFYYVYFFRREFVSNCEAKSYSFSCLQLCSTT